MQQAVDAMREQGVPAPFAQITPRANTNENAPTERGAVDVDDAQNENGSAQNENGSARNEENRPVAYIPPDDGREMVPDTPEQAAGEMDLYDLRSKAKTGVETLSDAELQRYIELLQMEKRYTGAFPGVKDQGQITKELNAAIKEMLRRTDLAVEAENAPAQDVVDVNEAGMPEGETVAVPITADMNEEERYHALKDRRITLRAKANVNGLTEIEARIGRSASEAKTLKETERKKLFKKIGEEFHVFNEYENRDINLSFEFSRNNMRESTKKQSQNYSDFAKMLSCLPDIIDTAVGIEVHNRNEQGYKPDPTLKNVFVLIGAFEDGDRVVPVKLEVKEFNDKANALYVAVTLESIKKDEVVKQGDNGNGFSEGAQSSRSSIINIADLCRKINPHDTSFLKYIPQQFFTGGDNQNEGRASVEVPGDLRQQQTEAQREAERIDAEQVAEWTTPKKGIDINPDETETAVSSAVGLTAEDNEALGGGEITYNDRGVPPPFGPTVEEQEAKATEQATKEGNAALKAFAESMPDDPMDLYQKQQKVTAEKKGAEKITTQKTAEKKTLRQKAADAWHTFMRSMANDGDAIHQAGRNFTDCNRVFHGQSPSAVLS